MSQIPELLTQPEWTRLHADLRRAAAGALPERAVVRCLTGWTGGGAEIRASWGAVVATAGSGAGEGQTFRLQHGRRHVGALTLWVDPAWNGLGPLAADYALLARLSSAAAGAARRRVGERTLATLLSGETSPDADAYAVALADFGHGAGTGARAQAAQAYALDVLAEVGEGFLNDRELGGLATVWQGRALWWWPAQEPQREGAALFAALQSSVGSVRLGLSGQRGDVPLSVALREAEQALGSAAAGQFVPFRELDPLTPLLASEAAAALRSDLRARLAALDDAAKVEATLRAYLRHSGTLGELAAAQNIHVNTLRYRLKRAEEVLGLRLSEPQALARLYLALEGGA